MQKAAYIIATIILVTAFAIWAKGPIDGTEHAGGLARSLNAAVSPMELMRKREPLPDADPWP